MTSEVGDSGPVSVANHRWREIAQYTKRHDSHVSVDPLGGVIRTFLYTCGKFIFIVVLIGVGRREARGRQTP